jgi:hypothetical protein
MATRVWSATMWPAVGLREPREGREGSLQGGSDLDPPCTAGGIQKTRTPDRADVLRLIIISALSGANAIRAVDIRGSAAVDHDDGQLWQPHGSCGHRRHRQMTTSWRRHHVPPGAMARGAREGAPGVAACADGGSITRLLCPDTDDVSHHNRPYLIILGYIVY